jgi:hypothetical protein
MPEHKEKGAQAGRTKRVSLSPVGHKPWIGVHVLLMTSNEVGRASDFEPPFCGESEEGHVAFERK